MNTRPISDTEWNAFCDATPFPNGARPEYANGTLENGKIYCVVINSEMATLMVGGEEDGDCGSWYAEFKPLTPEAARAILSGLGEPRTLQDFLDYGFQTA